MTVIVPGGTALLPSPIQPITVKAPPQPSTGLIVAVAGAPGKDGEPGVPGAADYDDIPDLTLLFENGLI